MDLKYNSIDRVLNTVASPKHGSILIRVYLFFLFNSCLQIMTAFDF